MQTVKWGANLGRLQDSNQPYDILKVNKTIAMVEREGQGEDMAEERTYLGSEAIIDHTRHWE